jgi:hypothetical protein
VKVEGKDENVFAFELTIDNKPIEWIAIPYFVY